LIVDDAAALLNDIATGNIIKLVPDTEKLVTDMKVLDCTGATTEEIFNDIANAIL